MTSGTRSDVAIENKPHLPPIAAVDGIQAREHGAPNRTTLARSNPVASQPEARSSNLETNAKELAFRKTRSIYRHYR